MAEGMKIAVRQGGGPDPGYFWNVFCLNAAHDESEKILSAEQYDHAADLVRQLARHEDPTHSQSLSIRPVEDFYEIRDKGGVLQNINLRIFFCIDRKAKAIIILGVIKKQNDGQTPLGDKVRMRYRKRKYQEGAYGMALEIVKYKEKG